MKKLIILFFLLLILPSPFLLSQQNIDGDWKGNISIMGTDLEFFVKFISDPDSMRGTMDIPIQGAKDLKIIHVGKSSSKVHFELPAGPGLAVFDGVFANDSIKGDFTQSGLNGNFYLVRGERIIEPPKEKEILPYDEEEVTFKNGDISFAGTLTIPKTKGKHPAVVMITGSGPQNRDEELFGFKIFRIIADNFTRKGITVLRYDDRNVGGSTGKSVSESTTEELAGDVIEAVNFLKNRDDINQEQIGLCGHSEGGIIAPMIASKNNDIAFIILIGGTGVKGIDLLKEQSRLITLASGGNDGDVNENNKILDKTYDVIKTNKGWNELREYMEEGINNSYDKMTDKEKSTIKDRDKYVKDLCDLQLEQMRSPWMKYFINYDPIPSLEKVKCPVLMLFGENDLQVPPKQNKEPMEKALKRGGNKDFTSTVIPKANHLFQVTDTGRPDEYVKLPKEFAPGFLDTMSNWIIKRVTILKE